MLRPVRFIPSGTKIDFVGARWWGFGATLGAAFFTVLSLLVFGLNYGIDFTGGILIEARAAQTPDLSALRTKLNDLGLGEVGLQQYGGENELLIRVQPHEGGEQAQAAATGAIREALGDGFELRRQEMIGPQVSSELLTDGIIAALLAVVFIAAYVAFRFEWQFGISALIATFHDVFVIVGFYSVLQLQFDLTSVAALLTIAGYSINDTVVVFDRIRENLRKYKKVDFATLINLSVNETLSRTVLTGGSTLLAIIALLVFAGPVIFGFALAIFVGILIGTYSSIFIAGTLLLYMKPLRHIFDQHGAQQEPTQTPPPAIAPPR